MPYPRRIYTWHCSHVHIIGGKNTVNYIQKKNKMNTKDLTHANKRRTKEVYGRCAEDWSLPEWGNAVAGETGEMCNIIKKVHRGDFKGKEYRHLLSDEIGDIVIYLDLLCQKAGLDLGQCIVNKFNRTSAEKHSNIIIFNEL